ncbi:MAG: hypothetical protein Q3983_01305 [Capnocytophaga sp.]|nr:hypothetical protein [Capnocytophaga sp.]
MRHFILATFILFCSPIFAQNKIYIDDSGNEVPKEEASFMRQISEKNGLFFIKDYYLNGKIQMSVTTKEKNFSKIEQIIGKFIFYHENGKVQMTGEEKNGIIKGKQFDDKGRMELSFTHTLPITAYEQIHYTDNKNIPNIYSYYQNNTLIKEISFGEDMKKARVEYHYKDGEISYLDYYDEKGNKIGSNSYSDTDTYRLFVDYYYNPMRVKSISERDENKKIIRQEEYFTNGKLFSKEEATSDGSKVTYYDKMGKKIGELINKYEIASTLLDPYEGTQFVLSEKGNIIEKREYNLGFFSKISQFYENGITKSIAVYDIDNSLQKITFYDRKGKEKSSLTYEAGLPYTGTHYDNLEENDSFISYKEGVKTEVKNYDQKKILRYSKKINENGTYFCEVFNELGQKQYTYELTYDGEYATYPKKMEITQYENGKITHTATIDNGILVKGSIWLSKDVDIRNNLNLKTENLIEATEDFIISKRFLNGEIIKEAKFFIKHPNIEDYSDSFMDDFTITEDSLTDFSYDYAY